MSANSLAIDASNHPQPCFHCGLPVPFGSQFSVNIDGLARQMCCPGCEAVARAIIEGGLGDYYRFRTEKAVTGQEAVPAFLRQILVYDDPKVQHSFVRAETGEIRDAALILEGITCAACVWLNERHIARLPGVLSVQVNYATHRARVRWDNTRIKLSEILVAVSHIGYRAHPYNPDHAQRLLEAERRDRLRRLGVAAAFGMQVMVLAVALYVGAVHGISLRYKSFFRWISLLLTLPVLLYSAQVFFRSAWRDLMHGRAGMDVPVSLGIAIAFGGSVWATVTGRGEVYYDSVVMFVFFLLAGRYFELNARKRAAESSEALVHLVPAMATRMVAEGEGWREESVPVSELATGDRVLVRPGDTIPADGRVVAGKSTVDESLLSGESLPIGKQAGAGLVGGSINIESPLQMDVEKVGADMILSGMLRLLDRAQSEKPDVARFADRAASWFVSGVLLLAAIVTLYWWHAAPNSWLPILIAVLVVTCPCALSLATPTAITAATGSLTRRGLLTTRGHALETLAKVTHFVFDKTGTLTVGRPKLIQINTFSQVQAGACLEIAAALERYSEHPVGRALVGAMTTGHKLSASDVVNEPGAGLQGRVGDTKYFIGTPRFVADLTGRAATVSQLEMLTQHGHTVVLLATVKEVLAAFVVGDEIRADAKELVAALKADGKSVLLLTGDNKEAASYVADAVGIDDFAYGLRPQDKLERVRSLQAQNACVAMVGDGINDAAAMAGAHVSIAMGGGAQVAAASADMILLSGHLKVLLIGVRMARKTMRIIRQNFARAVAYNIVAVPAAAMGYVPPWVAALGMSASSLMVVLNALRLVDRQTDKDAGSQNA